MNKPAVPKGLVMRAFKPTFLATGTEVLND